MPTETIAQEDYQAALDRIRDYRQQLEGADRQADQNSLDRARDLEVLYQAMQWVDEVPAPKHQVWRGRPVDPRSRNRFATWVLQSTGLSPSQVRYLHLADETRELLLTSTQIPPTSANAIRPLWGLRKQGYGDNIGEVYKRAVELAEGGEPTATEVRQAKRDFLAKYTRTQRQTASAGERLQRYQKRIADDFTLLLGMDPALAGTTLNGLIDTYNARTSGSGS